MASNIEYDPYLLSEVLKVGGFKYKKDAVNAALKEYLQHHQQVQILDLFGSIEYDGKYDYKKEAKTLMEVLVDTSIWSLALRRKKQKAAENTLVSQFSELINETRVRIIGPIRQELLSGIPEELQFQKLKKHLEAFEDLPIISKNYERAAEMHNQCRRQGINGGHIDFLICSVAEYHHLAIFTSDKDFVYYAKHLPITLYY